MRTEDPLIFSILTTHLNQGYFLGEALASALSQEGAFYIDYILVDAGSTDLWRDEVECFRRILQSLIIAKVNLTLKGRFEYFKHSHKTTFPSPDGWIRMRLCSILRKRKELKGRGRGSDHQRWSNAF